MSVIRNLFLNFSEDQFALKIDELSIPDEGVTAFWGPSGAGKTTLFKTMIGLYQPKDWFWEFKGIEMHRLNIAQRQLGVVFQNYELFPHMTAEENIAIVIRSRFAKDEWPNAFRKLNDYKERLNLTSCWNTTAEKISGGEKQRISLLRALLSRPRILLLDEPFSALDLDLRQEARVLLKQVLQDINIPVYLITHDSVDVEMLAQTRIELRHGRIHLD